MPSIFQMVIFQNNVRLALLSWVGNCIAKAAACQQEHIFILFLPDSLQRHRTLLEEKQK